MVFVDLRNVLPDAVSVTGCCQRATDSLLSRHHIRTQDGRLSQPQPQKHSGHHGIRHEGFSLFLRATTLYAIARICHANSVCPSVCPSVRTSVTCVICVKTAERIIEILSPSDRPIILVFAIKGRCVNLTASPPTGATNTRG